MFTKTNSDTSTATTTTITRYWWDITLADLAGGQDEDGCWEVEFDVRDYPTNYQASPKQLEKELAIFYGQSVRVLEATLKQIVCDGDRLWQNPNYLFDGETEF